MLTPSSLTAFIASARYSWAEQQCSFLTTLQLPTILSTALRVQLQCSKHLHITRILSFSLP